MLYPEFEELIAYKNLRFERARPSCRPSPLLVFGGQRSLFRGQGLEFDSVRKYVPGDDLRIDWKVTARTGSPHLKIFQEEKQRPLVLCIDKNASMEFGTRGTFKSVQAARIAALLGWQGLAHKDRLHVCLFGEVPGGVEFFTPKQQNVCFSQVLRRLSTPSSEKQQIPLVEAFRRVNHAAQTGSLVYFVSDFMDRGIGQEQQIALNPLVQRCAVIFLSVNDPADKALLPVGQIGFSARGNEKWVVNTDSLAGRETYAHQWEENRKSLYQKAAQLGISLVELSTETDIKKELWPALTQLAKKRRR